MQFIYIYKYLHGQIEEIMIAWKVNQCDLYNGISYDLKCDFLRGKKTCMDNQVHQSYFSSFSVYIEIFAK